MCCFCHLTTEILYKPIKRQIQKEREEGKTDKQRKKGKKVRQINRERQTEKNRKNSQREDG